MLPTLYFLSVRYWGNGDWAIFERHRGQEKGCFLTDEQLLSWARSKEEAVEIAENFKPLEGEVAEIEVEE